MNKNQQFSNGPDAFGRIVEMRTAVPLKGMINMGSISGQVSII